MHYNKNGDVMKNHKIKKKYLNQEKETRSICDKIEQKLGKISITFLLILLLLTWGIIPTILLKLINIPITSLKEGTKVFLSFLNDSLLIILLIKIYQKTYKKDKKTFFDENTKNHIKYALKYWLLGLIIMIISNQIIAIFTNGELATNEKAVRSLINNYPLYMVFQLIIYAPLTEEIIFRKSIKDIIQNKSLYIFISGLIFGGMHMISSIKAPQDLLYLIPYCSLGFVFAYLYQKTDNIFYSIVAHSAHNTLALIFYYLGAMIP